MLEKFYSVQGYVFVDISYHKSQNALEGEVMPPNEVLVLEANIILKFLREDPPRMGQPPNKKSQQKDPLLDSFPIAVIHF